jgi:hypothetical protein
LSVSNGSGVAGNPTLDIDSAYVGQATITTVGTLSAGDVTTQVSAASDTLAGRIEIAIQSEMETGTDTVRAVTPGRQQFHASAAKFWVITGVTGNNLASYNVASVADTGVGIMTVTIATDFSSANWAAFVSISNLDATIDSIADGMMPMIANASQTAGVVQVINKIDDGIVAADPQFWYVCGFGDQ